MSDRTPDMLVPGSLTIDRGNYGEARCWMIVTHSELVDGVWTERRESFVWEPCNENNYAAGIARAILPGYAELENFVTAQWHKQHRSDKSS